MNTELKEHFQIKFQRLNLKYNRLWSQIGTLGIFFVGTLFGLILSFVDAIATTNIFRSVTSGILAIFLAIFCGLVGLILYNEIKNVGYELKRILWVFYKRALKSKK